MLSYTGEIKEKIKKKQELAIAINCQAKPTMVGGSNKQMKEMKKIYNCLDKILLKTGETDNLDNRINLLEESITEESEKSFRIILNNITMNWVLRNPSSMKNIIL